MCYAIAHAILSAFSTIIYFFSFWLTSISLASSFPGSTQRLAQAALGIPPLDSYIYLGILNSIIAHITHSVLTVD